MTSAFWVLEGMDGCGKTTQAENLVAALEADGRQPLHLREPGSTGLGEGLRAMLLDKKRADWDPRSEALMFFAARNQLLRELVAPALAAGHDVVCERFTPSTLAYQGQTPELRQWVLELDRLVVAKQRPDCVFILDLAAEDSFARVGGDVGHDSFEARGVSFQQKVREGYLSYAQAFPQASKVIAVAQRSIEDIAQEILAVTQDRRS
ncbi:MAG: dTMP kinase [Planctomycetes bacterium]|nr:dTMP kinase [Planctomycetota bacterium]MCP4772427.1 dTMP kinase [Planctomycetota bacterium]MCP4860180.1 dTMP kinase [Planctomycetota bacterium]